MFTCHDSLHYRGKVDGQYTTRTLSAKDGSKELSGVEDIVHEEQNEWINSAQVNAKFQLSNDLHRGDSKEPPPPVEENVETLDEPRSHQDEWKRHLPVIIDGEHLQDDLDHDPRQDGNQNDKELLKEASHRDDPIEKYSKSESKAFVKPDGVAHDGEGSGVCGQAPTNCQKQNRTGQPVKETGEGDSKDRA